MLTVRMREKQAATEREWDRETDGNRERERERWLERQTAREREWGRTTDSSRDRARKTCSKIDSWRGRD